MSHWDQPQGRPGPHGGHQGQVPESAQPTVLRPRPGGFSTPPAGWGGQGFGAPGGFGQAPGRLGQPGPPAGPPPGYPPAFPPAFPPPQQRPQPGRSGTAIKLMIGVVALAIVCGVLYSALGGLTGTRYQNEDYRVPEATTNPPELPFPNSQSELEAYLKDNPIYRTTVNAPVRCELPAIDVMTASDSELKSFFEKQMECTMRVWGPTFDQTKFKLHRPTVTVYGKSVKSPCGEAGVNAFYCGANQQLYYSRYLPHAEQLALVREPKMVDMVMAHEFAHLMQGRTGMTASYAIAARRADASGRREGTRRLEAQADCWAGMYLRSTAQSRAVTQKDAENYIKLYHALGDDSLTGKPNVDGDHGLGATRKYWGQLGLSTDQVGKCNSWTVPSSQVR